MKCTECGNTLKQVGNSNGYYCDSAPKQCTLSTKVIYKKLVKQLVNLLFITRPSIY